MECYPSTIHHPYMGQPFLHSHPHDVHSDLVASPPALPAAVHHTPVRTFQDMDNVAGLDMALLEEPLEFDDRSYKASCGPASSSSFDMTASWSSASYPFTPPDSAVDFSQAHSSRTTSPDVGVNAASSPVDVKPACLGDSAVWATTAPDTETTTTTTMPTADRHEAVTAAAAAATAAAAAAVPSLRVWPETTKTRVETQIKVKLTLDPLPAGVTTLHLPRKTISKPKLLANDKDREHFEAKPTTLELTTFLVCASAVESPERVDQALRRARGDELVPRSVRKRSSSDSIKSVAPPDDPAHPLNGGEVRICDNCMNRERKRHERKRIKKSDDEDVWRAYEPERVIIFNDKEYKKWDNLQPTAGEHHYLSPRAKQIEFPMRIACYCRHQGEKLGFRAIFTVKDAAGRLVAQTMSDVLAITDDHKTKEGEPVDVAAAAAASRSLDGALRYSQPYAAQQPQPQSQPQSQPQPHQHPPPPPPPAAAAVPAYHHHHHHHHHPAAVSVDHRRYQTTTDVAYASFPSPSPPLPSPPYAQASFPMYGYPAALASPPMALQPKFQALDVPAPLSSSPALSQGYFEPVPSFAMPPDATGPPASAYPVLTTSTAFDFRSPIPYPAVAAASAAAAAAAAAAPASPRSLSSTPRTHTSPSASPPHDDRPSKRRKAATHPYPTFHVFQFAK